jgi:hypothetical protein
MFAHLVSAIQKTKVSGNFMTTIKLITTIILFVTMFGCNANKESHRQNTINRIVFATNGCFGTCPIQTIDIDSSLNFKYHGIQHVDNKGFYLGKITKGFWDTLNIKFENIKYRQLDTSYEHTVDDLSTELYVYHNKNKVKYIRGQSISLPDNVREVYYWLLISIKHLKFQKTTDSLVFPIHVPRIEHITFPPNKNITNKKKSYR